MNFQLRLSSIFLALTISTTVFAQEAPPTVEDASASDEPLPLVKNPELLEYVQAPYPEAAKEDGREGTVLL